MAITTLLCVHPAGATTASMGPRTFADAHLDLGRGSAKRTIGAVQEVNVDNWGASGDGRTDDAPAFERAARALESGCGKLRTTHGKRYYVSTLDIPACVVVEGDFVSPDSPSSVGEAGRYGRIGGIILSPSGTITLNSDSGLKHLYIQRLRMTFPAQDTRLYAGTAITCATTPHPTGPFVDGVMVLGFEFGMVCRGGADRPRVTHFYTDSVNGLYAENSWDTAVYRDLHFWPYAQYPNTSNAALERAGIGFELEGQQDDTECDQILTFGYRIGLKFGAKGNIICGTIWSDQVASPTTSNTVGVQFIGPIGRSYFQDIHANGSKSAIEFDHGNNLGAGTINIGNLFAQTPAPAGNCMVVKSGNVYISLIDMVGCPSYPIVIGPGAGNVFIGGGHIILSNGGTAAAPTRRPYVALGPGLTTNSISLNHIFTDQAPGASLMGVNVLELASVKADRVIAPPNNTDYFRVVGTASIAVIQGFFGGREITVELPSGATITNAGNVALKDGAKKISGPGVFKFLNDGQIWQQE